MAFERIDFRTPKGESTFDPADPPLDTMVDLEPQDADAFDERESGINGEASMLEDGGAVVDFDPQSQGAEGPAEFYDNLAEFMAEEDLEIIGKELVDLVKADKDTLKDWEDIYVEGMKLLGFKPTSATEAAFEGGCTATHPVLAESIVKYQAKARSQLLPGTGPVRAQILGRATPEKEAQAQRVKEFMNFQIQTLMPEYEPEHDRMLFHQAFSGLGITKTYFDSLSKRPCSHMVAPQKFIIDYNATDLQSAYRYTEVITLHINELRQYQLNGFYRKTDVDETDETDKIKEEADAIEGRKKGAEDDKDHVTLYEIHTYLALDEPNVDDRTEEEVEAGLELPYIVTVDVSSGNVLAIRRNWREADERREKRLWFTAWPFIPGFGFFGYGYVHLIGGLSKTATVSLRQLIDAGSFASLPAGFKATGLRVVGDNAPLQPGEWRDANAPGYDLSKAFLPLPYREPSTTLYNLLEFMVQAAQKFADSTEQVVSDSSNYGPVGTTLALLEASGRLFSGIHERLFKSQKAELAILSEINAESLPDEYPYDVVGGDRKIFKQDFDGRVDIVPVTDPRVPTAAHRVAKANATLSIASQFPQYHNMRNVLHDLHESLGAEDPDKYMAPPPAQAKAADPLTENQWILTNIPVMSAPYQDHDSHVQVHLALVNNPMYSQNPSVIQATMAHIQEHLAQKMRVDIERMVGRPLPQPAPNQPPPPPEQENEIARIAAQAMHSIKQEQMQDSMMSDPAVMLQMAELKLRDAENQLKKYDIDTKDRQFYEEQTVELKKLYETIKKDLKIARESNETKIKTTRKSQGTN
jgi:hypothetical protein